jgi:hypothetical protein
MGAFPREPQWAVAGQVNGTSYRHDAVLMVAGGAAPSPHSRTFDPLRLPRIQAVEADLTSWLNHFDRRPDERYVSDGDPAAITVPRGMSHTVRPSEARRVLERQ